MPKTRPRRSSWRHSSFSKDRRSATGADCCESWPPDGPWISFAVGGEPSPSARRNAAGRAVLTKSLEAFQFPYGPPSKPLGDNQFEVAFSYRPGKKVKSVYLAGSFNDWKPTAHKMDGPDKDGRFTTVLKLKKGLYEYKFVLDGQTWETDTNNPWRTGFYQNSLLYIGASP
jgi:hypothetical protein